MIGVARRPHPPPHLSGALSQAYQAAVAAKKAAFQIGYGAPSDSGSTNITVDV